MSTSIPLLPPAEKGEKELQNLLAKFITRESHKGSVNRMRLLASEVLIAWRNRAVEEAKRKTAIEELKMARDNIPNYNPNAIDQLQGRTGYNEYIMARLASLTEKETKK